MKYLQNLHIHSTYCDGSDTLGETVICAIEKGFDSIGFSAHSYMHFSPYPSMTPEKSVLYKQEIKSLKEKYHDKIKIFCGIEFERYSDLDLSGYDYIIGTLHYLKIGDEYVGFDRNAETVKNVIDKYFNGNGLLYAKEYYRQLITLPECGKFDFIGHFDIITKHSEKENFFDTSCKEYQYAAIEAAEALAGKIPYFEVNTGAIARGYRTTPYPEPFLLKEMKRLGYGVLITSDCHDKNYLDCGYDISLELIKQSGFKEINILTDEGFKPVEI